MNAVKTGVPGLAQAAELRPLKKGRLSINLATNLGNLIVSTAVGICYVPFLVGKLGPAAYGLIPLATVLTSYMGVLTLALNSAVARGITIALERDDHEKANRIFNTSLWGSAWLSLLLCLPAALGIAFLDRLVAIPSGLLFEARLLFASVAAAFLLGQVRAAFEVASFCRNRFDLRNAVDFSELLLRVGLIVTLFLLVAPRVSFVGAAILLSTAFSFVAMVFLWRRLTPMLRIQVKAFDWGTLKELTQTGFWVVVNHLGALLYLGVDLIIANRLFGAEMAGRYAAVLQLSAFIRSLSSSIGPVFGPTAMYYFAQRNIAGLAGYLQWTMKAVGPLLLLPIALTCGFAEPLLVLWLGPSFADMAPLLFFMTVHLAVNLTISPLLSVQLTANRVKVSGIVTLVLGVGNLLLALALAKRWGLYGIVAAGAIMLTAKNLLFTPLYAARILEQPLATFLRPIAPITLATFAVIALCQIIDRFLVLDTWPRLIGVSAGIAITYLAAAYAFLLSARERQQIHDLLARWRLKS